MEKQNRRALAYLLIGISAAGRALLAMPDNTQIQELSLTVLAVVGYLLVCRRTVAPLVCGALQLVLELVLCGSQSGGIWQWLLPALRAADLWLLLATAVLMLRQAGQPARSMPLAATVPLAVYSVAHFSPFVGYGGFAGFCGVQRGIVVVCRADAAGLQRGPQRSVSRGRDKIKGKPAGGKDE